MTHLPQMYCTYHHHMPLAYLNPLGNMTPLYMLFLVQIPNLLGNNTPPHKCHHMPMKLTQSMNRMYPPDIHLDTRS